MKVEIWKPVVGFEGLYEVSNLGRIKSLERLVTDKNGKRTRRFKERILNNVCITSGYHLVSLHRNEKRECRRLVHRLVMMAFDPVERPDDYIVDHINGIRTDNRIENLRWADFNTNNRNTPYIRYLQNLLKENNIEYIGEDIFESRVN